MPSWLTWPQTRARPSTRRHGMTSTSFWPLRWAALSYKMTASPRQSLARMITLGIFITWRRTRSSRLHPCGPPTVIWTMSIGESGESSCRKGLELPCYSRTMRVAMSGQQPRPSPRTRFSRSCKLTIPRTSGSWERLPLPLPTVVGYAV